VDVGEQFTDVTVDVSFAGVGVITLAGNYGQGSGNDHFQDPAAANLKR
jgi:hypothetical protein